MYNITSNFGANYHITSNVQNKGHFVSEQCNYNNKKCCTGKVVVQYLVWWYVFLCSGHTSKISCDQEHCIKPTTTCLPIRARLTCGIRMVHHVGNWQVVVFGQIFINIKGFIVVNSLNILMIKGKYVSSMSCKLMKHLEVIFWGNRERHEIDFGCAFVVWWWLVYHL